MNVAPLNNVYQLTPTKDFAKLMCGRVGSSLENSIEIASHTCLNTAVISKQTLN